MNKPVYLSAREAAAELGVQPATLYAYVSRGLVRSVPGPGKQKRYDAADIRALQSRREGESGPLREARAGEGLPTPPLETRLTLINERGPHYRGHSALTLAEVSSLEAVATLLWQAEMDPFADLEDWVSATNAEEEARGNPLLSLGRISALERLMARLSTWSRIDVTSRSLAGPLLELKGAWLLYSGFAALLDTALSAKPLHRQMADAWGVKDPEVTDLIRMALVLCADHELNTSAYAVRCAASTRAPLHACLLSGMGAFMGPRHGLHSDRVQAWLSDIDEPDTVWGVLSARLERGEDLPGFGHILYGDGDPRADMLLQGVTEAASSSLFLESLPVIREFGMASYALFPNIDFALVALQRACFLPKDAPKIIFCAGRMVGWIAHAMEQYKVSDQIRPRATYVGPRPG